MNALLEDIRSALSRGDGIKALLLDELTRNAISPVISHSELLSYDFFLFETISSARQPIDVSCIAILSKNSLCDLIKEVERQTYKEYYVFITDELSDAEIAMIAKKDTDGVIKELQELYFAGVPVDSRFVILNGTDPQEVAHSLSCFLKGLSIVPGIRYLFGSEVCYKTAAFIESSFKSDKKSNADLLIVDRAMDLFTPLQYPWTYQSMAAEYLEYKPGMISWGSNSLCISRDDTFFSDCKFKDIQYATDTLKRSLEEVKASREVVGEFVTNVRERARESSRLTLHLKALGEISSACIENDFVSETMADLIEGVPLDLLEQVREATEQQKIRLAFVEYLCAEVLPHSSILAPFWKEKKAKWMLSDGYKNEIKKYAEMHLKDRNLCTKRPVYQKNQNRKLGYTPEIVRVVNNLKNNRLSSKRFPIIRESPQEKKILIVFITGGATFIEYRSLVLLFSELYPKEEVILVSDKLVTGKSFVSDILKEMPSSSSGLNNKKCAN
ncbi:vacuolar protein sorting-associated protein 45 [Nematocida minor]|uniref:vacuolar protein sorting-associated protein 45 n=1 Tax=Nematocida minor TaxID=1912983 RepID=UPI00221EB241|nr:vacuolar protein sorting-associated protein 45 [Nematocida minor]KAI5190412.1 vacuolar protein sorting-associated protein 45 [Nematocida minor]